MTGFGESVREAVTTHSRSFDHCPGNGYRYMGVFTTMPSGDVHMTWWRHPTTGGVTFNLQAHSDFLHYDYFMEKTHCRESDAAALLALIHQVTGRKVRLPPGFDSEGFWDRENQDNCVDLD